MKQPLIERIKFWICDTFGHVGLQKGKEWVHGGAVHCNCKFCGRVHSIQLVDKWQG
ncbi:TPA: hypothetical protein PEP05_000805 [Vibrio parahaemolyticus]|nr:hypothetical protein [Vibrio parahaemolyticus]